MSFDQMNSDQLLAECVKQHMQLMMFKEVCKYTLYFLQEGKYDLAQDNLQRLLEIMEKVPNDYNMKLLFGA